LRKSAEVAREDAGYSIPDTGFWILNIGNLAGTDFFNTLKCSRIELLGDIEIGNIFVDLYKPVRKQPKTTVMKRILLCCVLALFVQLSVSAQKSSVGFSGGLSFSNMSTLDNGSKVNGNYRTGCVFGLVVQTPINKMIDFFPGVYYVQKGMNQTPDIINNPNREISYAMRYTEFNLNFVAHTNKQKINVFGGFGPSIGLNLPSKKIVNDNGAKSTTELTFGKNGTEDFRGFDWGANVIVGLRHSCGVFLAFNYNQGFYNINGDQSASRIRNNYIGIHLGFMVKNKK